MRPTTEAEWNAFVNGMLSPPPTWMILVAIFFVLVCSVKISTVLDDLADIRKILQEKKDAQK